MFGRVKIAIDKSLFGKVKQCAELAGYSSAEELVTHVLEKEVQRIEASQSDDEIKRRLKGLGYLS